MANFVLTIYILTLIVDVVIGIYNFKRTDTALKIFIAFIVVILVNELTAEYVQTLIGSKSPVSHIYSIVELSFIAVYFLFTVQRKPRIAAIALCILLSTAFATGNLMFFQSWKEYNTNMLMAESVIISALALIALFRLVNREDIRKLKSYPHFRIWAILLISWTGSFFFWAFLPYMKYANSDYYQVVRICHAIFYIGIYAAIGKTLYDLKQDRQLQTL